LLTHQDAPLALGRAPRLSECCSILSDLSAVYNLPCSPYTQWYKE
ncbi:hypothetical protein KIPB_014828, partial [Kipferlia bialata]